LVAGIIVTVAFFIRPVKPPLAEKGKGTIQKGVNLGRLLSDLQTLILLNTIFDSK